MSWRRNLSPVPKINYSPEIRMWVVRVPDGGQTPPMGFPTWESAMSHALNWTYIQRLFLGPVIGWG